MTGESNTTASLEAPSADTISIERTITPQLKPKPNRAQRRKEAAYAQSATWKRLVRNSHKAAVRKLNNEAAFWASFTAAFADGAEFHSHTPGGALSPYVISPTLWGML